jgi:hypothetical protein
MSRNGNGPNRPSPTERPQSRRDSRRCITAGDGTAPPCCGTRGGAHPAQDGVASVRVLPPHAPGIWQDHMTA